MKKEISLTPKEKIEKYNIFMKICEAIRNIDENKQFLCIETEFFDIEKKDLTEIGWCIFKKDGTIVKNSHFLIKEIFNSVINPNSEILELNAIKNKLEIDIKSVNYIVGYEIDDILNTINILENTDIKSKFVKIKDSFIPEYGIIDTDDLCFGGSIDKSIKNLKYPYEKSFNIEEDIVNTITFLLKIIYNDYAKLINAIRHNISENRFFMCIDVESSKNNPNILSELGWCIFQKDGTVKKKKHVIVKENMEKEFDGLENDKHYLIGKPEIQDITSINEELKNDLKEINYIVSQRINLDLNLLKTINIDISNFVLMNNHKVPQYGIIDIMNLYDGIFFSNCQGLEQGLTKLGISYDELDNTGNKTHYIMDFFFKVIDKDKPEKYKDFVHLINSIRSRIDKEKLFLCLDIEAYELEKKFLTEFGWCIFKKDGVILENKHFIVKENMKYHNGIHVPDNRENYLFGKSEIRELKEIEEELKIDVAKVNYLVGQGVISDIRFLKKIKFKTSKFKKMNGKYVPEFGIIDTMDLYSGYFLKQGVSLEKMLIKLNISYDKLHNAGNDANYTMQVFLRIINGSNSTKTITSSTTKSSTQDQHQKEDSSNLEKFRNLVKMINAIQHNISKNQLYLSFDIEEYEQNKKLITEIGWCIFKKDGTIRKKKHAIVKENVYRRNSIKKPDNKDDYLFGVSDIQELKTIEEELRNDVEKVSFLVCHGLGKNDIRYLKSIKIDISKFIKMKLNRPPYYGLIDTMDLYSCLFDTKGVKLENSLTKLEIPFNKIYNSGNNAMYTMELFLKLMDKYKGNAQLSQEVNLKSITHYMQTHTKQKNNSLLKESKKEKSEKKEDSNQFQEQTKLVEAIRTMNNDKSYLCLDIEAYEFDQKKLTEFGWCIFKKDGTIIKKKHTNVEEYLKFRNGKHVPDNKEHFLFGQSDIQKLEVVEEELKKDIENVNYIVGHGIKSDINYLKSINVNTSKFLTMKNQNIPEFGVIDTMDIYSGQFNTKGVGLEKCLIKLEIPYCRLHNAGNDAMFTMQVFLKIINKSKTVPLQLSINSNNENTNESEKQKDNKGKDMNEVKEIKEKKEIEETKKEKNDIKLTKPKKEKKDESIQFRENEKLIEVIRAIDNDKLYLCLDIEAYEFDQKKLTEFGWCIFKKNGSILKKKHANVKEYLKFRNGKYVPDNKKHFLFGQSDIQKLGVVEEELKKDIESVNYIVGHGIKSDINYLKSINVNTSKFLTMKNQNTPEFGVIDTMDIYSGQFNTKGVGLEKCLIKLEIPYCRLHNVMMPYLLCKYF
ncbi:hypothetical protein BCR36DRAFT_190173 [Piromyces finnis]|uniref:Gfd2/YDR514C-like C-terminal domain-containing protein n=1 Tax=Piromyces finnis TaxID=1754191 RepID=A0A1Y1US05_9FUNG|nr:hypothetical protein BCR36DRAFT_190173 [Piromyces finnis]|eukprot:ORX40397.1 hypothetical protein BCR36DRAFT_190173 [Piromyces finnis]